MFARRAARRSARAAALFLSGALAACASPPPAPTVPAEALLEQFRSGQVRLDCARCRYDFRGAEWLLEDGHYEPLVLGILRSGDGSGRSWYLLGRAAEETGSPELALLYYRESLATSRQPINALWPLYEDVKYRMRRLVSQAPTQPAPAARVESGPVEKVNVEALVVGSRPGTVGAFVEKLHRGDAVEVLDRSGDWEQVRLADGRLGWVWGDYTSVSGAPPERRRVVAKAPATQKRVAKKSPPRPAPQKPVASRPAAPPPALPQSAALAPAPAPPTTPAPLAPRAPQKVDTTRSAVAARLVAAGTAGILACPLPQGAALSGRSHGSAGSDDHPTETYSIEAAAHEIVGFYETEMERAGWHKTAVSSELLLYFVKDDETVGVLVDREGGFFTLMGS